MTRRSTSSSSSLLYEGYALYPYTPGATKNATPTPFGIVYPPAYAERNAERLRRAADPVRARGRRRASSAEVRFLQASGERHQAEERRVELDAPGPARVRLPAAARPRARCAWSRARTGARLVTCCVHNTTELDGPGRRAAPRRSRASFLSTHVVVRTSAGPVHLAARGRRRPRQLLSRCWRRRRRRGAGRSDRAARPPAARAGEPRQPLRRHRDRGGAAAARAGAQRRRARGDRPAGPGRARDDRARGGRRRPRTCCACTGA